MKMVLCTKVRLFCLLVIVSISLVPSNGNPVTPVEAAAARALKKAVDVAKTDADKIGNKAVEIKTAVAGGSGKQEAETLVGKVSEAVVAVGVAKSAADKIVVPVEKVAGGAGTDAGTTASTVASTTASIVVLTEATKAAVKTEEASGSKRRSIEASSAIKEEVAQVMDKDFAQQIENAVDKVTKAKSAMDAAQQALQAVKEKITVNPGLPKIQPFEDKWNPAKLSMDIAKFVADGAKKAAGSGSSVVGVQLPLIVLSTISTFIVYKYL